MTPNQLTPPKDAGSSKFWTKIAVVAIVLVAFVVVYTQFGEWLSLRALARQEAQLRSFQQEHPLLVYGIAFLIYVVVTGLSLPGATVLTLVYGWYFGLLRGVVLVSFASTSGATVAFLLSRFLFRDVIERRFGDRLDKFNQAWQREGPFFLFMLRLIPAFPFFVINAVMGLTPIRVWTFWWVSQVGMFAATVVYVYAGSSVPSLQTLAEQGIKAVFTPSQLMQITAALVTLGVFPLLVRLIVKFLTRSRSRV